MTPKLPLSASGFTHVLALLAGALALFNVPPDLTDPIRTAVVAGAALISAVTIHEHHATLRSTNSAAAAISASHGAHAAAMAADQLSGMMSALASPPSPASTPPTPATVVPPGSAPTPGAA